MCSTVGYAGQPQSNWYTPRSQEPLASGPFWIPASGLSLWPIFLSPQTLWFCFGYLTVYVQAVLTGRYNHSRCDNAVNKPCQLTKENFKHFLFSLANETTKLDVFQYNYVYYSFNSIFIFGIWCLMCTKALQLILANEPIERFLMQKIYKSLIWDLFILSLFLLVLSSALRNIYLDEVSPLT